MKPNIVLVGMPGSGKSVVGKALSRLLRRTAVDTDAEVERLATMSIAEIFAAKGESHFRMLESAALATVLKTGGQIIAGGGGIVEDVQNRMLMRKMAHVIYLSAPMSLLRQRLFADKTVRPLLTSAATLENLFYRREKLYQQIAHLAVVQNTADLPADIAQKACVGLRHIKFSTGVCP